MKKNILFFLFIILLSTTYGQRTSSRSIALIPTPVSLIQKDGEFVLPAVITIISSQRDEIRKIADQLSKQIVNANRYKTKLQEGKSAASNSIFISLSYDNTIPDEGYRLIVNKKGITLLAKKPAGLFYGTQTLLQLFPVDKKNNNWTIPFITIEDYPRFGWRGLMLDVSRHFFTVAQVKDFIDQMVKYKFNLLHLHLTDDQGWRLQIKSLPKLTEVGAWRVERTGNFGTLSKPKSGETTTYGGFYTHDDIKELVKYAADRFVNILPEIDVPGHSLAALAAYPELSCTPGEYYVSPGDRFMVWPGGGGHFYGLLDNTLCPANEKVYDFIDKVFTEVAQLFPFGYIHMGGDETARNFWEKSEQVKALMQKEKLKDLDEVQSYFVKRVAKIISSKGKKMIGWDEILQGGLAPDAAV
ncbi:MAG: beta-N-acetylhexosaminidase, partial [Chitinophagaceae bacterium]